MVMTRLIANLICPTLPHFHPHRLPHPTHLSTPRTGSAFKSMLHHAGVSEALASYFNQLPGDVVHTLVAEGPKRVMAQPLRLSQYLIEVSERKPFFIL